MFKTTAAMFETTAGMFKTTAGIHNATAEISEACLTSTRQTKNTSVSVSSQNKTPDARTPVIDEAFVEKMCVSIAELKLLDPTLITQDILRKQSTLLQKIDIDICNLCYGALRQLVLDMRKPSFRPELRTMRAMTILWTPQFRAWLDQVRAFLATLKNAPHRRFAVYICLTSQVSISVSLLSYQQVVSMENTVLLSTVSTYDPYCEIPLCLCDYESTNIHDSSIAMHILVIPFCCIITQEHGRLCTQVDEITVNNLKQMVPMTYIFFVFPR